MLLSTATGLIGLIVIESPGAPDEAARGGVVGDDATLAQILKRLARGKNQQRGATPAAAGLLETQRTETASRFGVRRIGPRSLVRMGPSLVAANCSSLGDQLERAARQLRLTIAAGQAGAR